MNKGNMLFTIFVLSTKTMYGDAANAIFEKTADVRNTRVYSRIQGVQKEMLCIQKCSRNRRVDPHSCFSVNYFPANKTCELCHVVCSDETDTEAALGWINWVVVQQIFSTCVDWRKAGCKNNVTYYVNPAGTESLPKFQVECVMNDSVEDTRTIMHHDQEQKIDPGNCEQPRSCVKHVTYHAPYSQISAVVDASRVCKQFILFECTKTIFRFDTVHHQAWYTRDGGLMNYWGGATPGSGKCACGMTDSCACSNPGYTCNCDCNDSTLRSDSGYLTDKTALPVTKMAFGDMGDTGEGGRYQLGPLECFGIA